MSVNFPAVCGHAHKHYWFHDGNGLMTPASKPGCPHREPLQACWDYPNERLDDAFRRNTSDTDDAEGASGSR
jgi:hypothetical protein